MPNGKPRKTHVLSVGQSLPDRRRLSACLPEGRWQLNHASSVRSGIDMLSSVGYDAVISEILLPDGPWTGLRAAGCRCPSIIVVADGTDLRVWSDAISQGAYDILVKPYNTDELLYVLQSASLRRLQTVQTGHSPMIFP